jgi:predicted site-specific integrase-resolvase
MTLLAPRDVARRLRLSTSRVVQLDREGVLPAIRDSGGRRFYDYETVENFATERERRSGARHAAASGPIAPAPVTGVR